MIVLPNFRKLVLALFAGCVFSAASAQAQLYYDTNGTGNAGAGTFTSGNWNTSSNNWNNTSTGSGGTISKWNNTNNAGITAVFSAGTDATGTYTITVVAGGITAGGIVIEDGTPTFSGGTITFGDSSPTLDVASGRTLNWGSAGLAFSTAAANTLNLNTTSGYTGTSGGVVNFSAAKSNTALTVNLGGGTLKLSSNLTFDTLNVTGNSTIDFGGAAATLSLTNLTISNGVTLTITNWTDNSDFFYTTNFAGVTQDVANSGSLSQLSFTGFTANKDKWQSYDDQITPVPEPSTYGAILLLVTGGIVGLRRRKRCAA